MSEHNPNGLREEWAQAVTEGRVVRINEGEQFRMFPTLPMRDAWIAKCDPETRIDIAGNLPQPIVRKDGAA